MLLRRTLLCALLAPLLLAHAAPGDVPTPEQRLAMQISRAACFIIDADPLTSEAIAKATMLFEQAVELAPQDPEHWRYLLRAAVLAERDDLYDRAVRKLVELDPHDDVMRLRRLNLALQQYQTVDERIRRYRQLIAPEVRDRLGPALASRLALDLALLLRRHGDIDGFADALSQAVTIDPANRTAAAIAAGFFHLHVDDPYAEVELLTNLMLADPTDMVTQTALASRLLEAGAYPAAVRMYDLIERNHAAVQHPPPPGFLADKALALWAAGMPDEALRTIHVRQQEVDDRLRQQALQDDPKLDRMTLAQMHAPLDLTPATVRAAILSSQGAEETLQAVGRSMEMYHQMLVQGQEGRDLDPAKVAQIQARMAWITAWLGNDVDQIRTLLDEARNYKPLNEVAEARFQGWIALHEQRLDDAQRILASVADVDLAAKLGLARTCRLSRRPKDAARTYLAVARAEPGSLIGIWAMDRLATILGTRPPLSDQARAMNDLIDSISPVFFRYPERPSLAVELRLALERVTLKPCDPILVNLEITNNSPYPLAIDRNGPIRPQVLIVFSTLLESMKVAQELDPLIIDIERRLRLEPGQTLVVPVDLARFQLGDVMRTLMLRGTLFEIRGLLNFVIAENGTPALALLGSDENTDPIRIEGVTVSPQWIEDALEQIADPNPPEKLPTLALLSNVAAWPIERRQATSELIEMQDRVRDRFAQAWSQLGDAAQAWLVGIMPPELRVRPGERRLAPVRDMVLQGDNSLAHLVYLLYQIGGPDDPILDVALASPGPRVRAMAEGYIDLMERRREEAKKRLTPSQPMAPPGRQVPMDLGEEEDPQAP